MPEKIFVGNTPLGRGVFAKVPIEPRETIFYLTGKLIRFDEAVNLAEGEYTIQIDRELYVDPRSPARYLNHSCEPNAGFVEEIRLVAIRQLLPGEEIRFDYSTTMLERYWELECRCGAPRCRGLVRDFDLLPPSLQTRYLRLGIVQRFIVEEIAAQRGLPGAVA